jgi:hypothetical protein
LSSIAESLRHVKSTTLGATGASPERRKDDRGGPLGQARDAWHLFWTDITKIEHHPQHRLGLLDALGRQAHIVRKGPHGAIEVIAWDGVKRASRGGQPPEAATGRLGA